MKTSALGWTAHPTVAGEEAAAPTEGEAVGGVVTQELRLAGRHQRHLAGGLPPDLAVVGAGHRADVRHGGRGEGPLEGAVTQQRVAGYQEHRANTFTLENIFLIIRQFYKFW